MDRALPNFSAVCDSLRRVDSASPAAPIAFASRSPTQEHATTSLARSSARVSPLAVISDRAHETFGPWPDRAEHLRLSGPRHGRDRGPRGSRSVSRVRYIVATCMVVSLACLMPKAADAHPLGNFTVNLYSGVRLSSGHVEVDYVLEMAELSTQEQKPGMDLDANGAISPDEMQGWADRAAAQLLTNLHLVINGLPVELSTVSDSLRFRVGQAGLDLLYMQATYEGELPASGAADYRDDN